jgi:two-component system response regulator HydG
MSQSILIVEDEPLIRDLIKTYLEPGGYDFAEAGDIASARKNFANPAPDVVLLDLRLPDGNALTLLPDLKKNWPATRIVILTGYGSVDAAEEAYKQDDVFLLSKPFDADMLRAVLDLALPGKTRPKTSP